MSTFSQPKIYYRGFSTEKYENDGGSFLLTEIALVKADLLNHIFTSKGERVMMPDFGTRIPDLAFEPLDQETINIIKEDLTAVINLDPRVQKKSMNVYALPDNNTIVAFVDLYYIEFDVVDTLNLEVKVA